MNVVGTVTITFPKTGSDSIGPDFRKATIIENSSGLPIVTCCDFNIKPDLKRCFILADLEILCNSDGSPYLGKGPFTERYTKDGEIKTGWFTFLVTEFKVAK